MLKIEGPTAAARRECERVLRTLPRWFGIERSLRAHAAATTRVPTFVARNRRGRVVGFISVAPARSGGAELHCIAVAAACRGRGIGRRLHHHAERWLAAAGARTLAVTTLAPSHPDPAFGETRRFYEGIGYRAGSADIELHLPVQQMVKRLR